MNPRKKPTGTRLLALVALVSCFAFVGAAPASAATVHVSGVQSAPVSSAVCPDQTAGLPAYTMAGGLVGCWYTDTLSFRGNPLGAPSGAIQATGTEHFGGCLDLDVDGTCVGDPQGTLTFTYQLSAKFDVVTGAEIHGRCQHPIISGTGDLSGASGVLTFKDDVTNGTALYRGHVTLLA
jgi:hypothetical protein